MGTQQREKREKNGKNILKSFKKSNKMESKRKRQTQAFYRPGMLRGSSGGQVDPVEPKKEPKSVQITVTNDEQPKEKKREKITKTVRNEPAEAKLKLKKRYSSELDPEELKQVVNKKQKQQRKDENFNREIEVDQEESKQAVKKKQKQLRKDDIDLKTKKELIICVEDRRPRRSGNREYGSLSISSNNRSRGREVIVQKEPELEYYSDEDYGDVEEAEESLTKSPTPPPPPKRKTRKSTSKSDENFNAVKQKNERRAPPPKYEKKQPKEM